MFGPSFPGCKLGRVGRARALVLCLFLTLITAACSAGLGGLSTVTPTESATPPAAVTPAPSATDTPAPLTPSPTPTPRSLSPTSTAGPSNGPCLRSEMTVDELWGIADAVDPAVQACLDDRDIHVTGWLAPSWGIGGTATGIKPAWLGELPAEPVLWLKPHPSEGCFNEGDCVWLFVHVRPGSGAELGSPERWVEITGHFVDAAAQTCHREGSSGDPSIPFKDIIAKCRAAFVATAVRNVAPPSP